MNEHKHGYVSLILHAHLPYVRHLDRDDYMEERWFFEAMTETYLPLLDVFERLAEGGVGFRIAMTMSPTLLALMEDPLMQIRYEAHLRKLLGLARSEIERTAQDEAIQPVATMYAAKLQQFLLLYDRYDRNLIGQFRALQEQGMLDILTCAATHAFLPLIKNMEAIDAQIATAVADYKRHFGCAPRGIWLPECGYAEHIDDVLKAHGIQYFIVDAHGLRFAKPTPVRDLAAPIATANGIHAFARDPESSQQVWSSHEGYPGDHDYREYYRDIGWDLGWDDAEEWEYIRPHVLSNGDRIHTGIKYYRITGVGTDKQPYNVDWAAHKVRMHAAHFADCRERQLAHYAGSIDRKPIVVCPYDAELFGHWWYEGPAWIEALCREFDRRGGPVRLATPGDYIAEYPESQQAQIPFCSWGRDGYADVWLQGNNDWIYRHLHYAEDRLIQAATEMIDRHEEPYVETGDDASYNVSIGGKAAFGARPFSEPGFSIGLHDEATDRSERLGDRRDAALEATETAMGAAERLLGQAARELMLAQSSDWAFILDAGTVPSYAARRTERHLLQLHELLDMAADPDRFDAQRLAAIESQAPCFPGVNWRLYRRKAEGTGEAVHRLHTAQRGADTRAEASRPASAAADNEHSAAAGERSRRSGGSIVGAESSAAAPAPKSSSHRILMLAWEFPPLVVGGLARSVYDLSRHLARQGCDVHVITGEAPNAPAYELMNGVHVHRVSVLRTVTSIDFFDWVFQMNAAFTDCAISLIDRLKLRFDIIHAHDWLVYYAARELKMTYDVPLVATIHATENGRNHGNLHNELQHRIHSLEWELTYEASRVIVCSRSMRRELVHLFQLPEDKLDIIPNGVDLGASSADRPAADAYPFHRSEYAAPEESIIFYIGRLVHEKGVHVLLEAMSSVLERHPAAKLVIAGTGPMKQALMDQAATLPSGKVMFTGFISDAVRNELLAAADVCVFPSLYEPFGIVALEAMQSGTPLVVSDTGGLSEIIDHAVDGYKALPGHVESLAWHLSEMLANRPLAEQMAARAKDKVNAHYDWNAIAVRTLQIYEGVKVHESSHYGRG